MRSTNKNSRSGFTLIEILVVLGIVIAIAGSLGVPMYQRAATQRSIASLTKAIQAAKSAVGMYSAASDGQPVPYSTTTVGVLPLSGATFSALPAATLNKVCDLQTVLLTTKCLESPIAISMGTSVVPNLATAPQWNTSTQTWFTAADAAPTSYYVESATTIPTSSRLACSQAGQFIPIYTVNAAMNFKLDGSNNFPTGSRIIYWIIPRVDANTAYELAKQCYKGGTVAAAGSAQSFGPIMYQAADAAGLTTVYAYVTHY
jgi:type II secretory pathway pseudopilin PulG